MKYRDKNKHAVKLGYKIMVRTLKIDTNTMNTTLTRRLNQELLKSNYQEKAVILSKKYRTTNRNKKRW